MLSLCLRSRLLGRLYLSRKILFGGHARRVVGRASGMGLEKNPSLSISSIVSLCLGSFWRSFDIKLLEEAEREMWSGNE